MSMKKLIFSAAAALFALASGAQATVEVESIQKVATPADMSVLNYTLSPDGSCIVFSTTNSINRLDLASGDVTKIADATGAYRLQVSEDGSQVVYNEPSFKDKLRYVSLKSANVNTGKVVTLVKPSRHLNSGYSLVGNSVNAVENGKLRTKALDKAKSQQQAVVSINYGHLDVTVDGVTTSIDPQGRSSYLWPALSPDGTKIVYWCSGAGCFVCDLDGSNPISLGELRAATWAGNDKVVGMLDRDNGVVLTSSEIIISDLDGNKTTLTGDDMIAINPSATADGRKIAFTTEDGDLYLINLK